MIRAAVPLILTLILGPVHCLAPVHTVVEIIDARAPSVERMIQDAADRHGLRLGFLMQRVREESGFDPEAVAPDGCTGLMQLNPLFFPGAATMTIAENLEAGASYLARQLEACDGSERCAHKAYRSGRVQR